MNEMRRHLCISCLFICYINEHLKKCGQFVCENGEMKKRRRGISQEGNENERSGTDGRMDGEWGGDMEGNKKALWAFISFDNTVNLTAPKHEILFYVVCTCRADYKLSATFMSEFLIA